MTLFGKGVELSGSGSKELSNFHSFHMCIPEVKLGSQLQQLGVELPEAVTSESATWQ